MESREWITVDDNRPQIPQRPRNAAKLMVVPFFDKRGLLEVGYYENTTINKHNFLALIMEVQDLVRVRRGVNIWRHPYLLHMDNAPAHRADIVRRFLRQKNWPLLTHPPYSPDLSPCDFFLFPLLKRKLRGREFPNTFCLRIAIEAELALITAAQWRNCFLDWVKRCQRCIAFNGAYFKGMKHLPQQGCQN